jgi:hypothetical protein
VRSKPDKENSDDSEPSDTEGKLKEIRDRNERIDRILGDWRLTGLYSDLTESDPSSIQRKRNKKLTAKMTKK